VRSYICQPTANADHLPRHRRCTRACSSSTETTGKRSGSSYSIRLRLLGTDRARRVPDDAIAAATSRITTVPAPVEAPSPIVTGATSELFEPMNTSRPIVVAFLFTPS